MEVFLLSPLRIREKKNYFYFFLELTRVLSKGPKKNCSKMENNRRFPLYHYFGFFFSLACVGFYVRIDLIPVLLHYLVSIPRNSS